VGRRSNRLLLIEYPYFETAGTVFVEETYAGSGTLAALETVLFNHGRTEIFTALSDARLTMTMPEEHREVPWNPLGDAMAPRPDFDGEWVLAQRRDRMLLSYIRCRP
jgi:hypothetical protein